MLHDYRQSINYMEHLDKHYRLEIENDISILGVLSSLSLPFHPPSW